MNSLLPEWVCQTLSLIFLLQTRDFIQFFYFFILANLFLGWVHPAAAQMHSPERRVGYRCSSIRSNSRMLIENPRDSKAGQTFLTKREFSELTSIEKYTLAFILNFHKHFSSQNFLGHHFSKSNLKPNQSLPLFKKTRYLISFI